MNVFKSAFDLALQIHLLTKLFPVEEKYSLTDQIRRSSRSVAANIAEAFIKRRYPISFVSKLLDCEGEVAEAQVWLKFANSFGYLDEAILLKLDEKYDHIQAQLFSLIKSPKNGPSKPFPSSKSPLAPPS
ncbi:MAG: four helix bundle protein [Prolixibacteraceae bacterium]